MKITNLEINNFLTIGHADLKLSNKGLVLIQGENKADDSANSNGAGKSTIPDALCWALYGETARGIKGDLIVNRTAKKNAVVKVKIDDDGIEYDITRYRKHKEHKNRLFVSVDGIDKTKGTDKLTQDFLTELMGCSLDVFTSAVYSGQEKMPDLPGMTDKQLKVLVEESAGIDKLQAAHQVAKDKLKDIKAEMAILESTFDRGTSQLKFYEEDLTEALTKEVAWDINHKESQDNEKKKMAVVKKEYDELGDRVEAIDNDAIKTAIADVKDKIASIDSEKEQRDELAKEANAAESKLKMFVSELNRQKRALNDAVKAQADVEHKVGDSCGECGKIHTEEDLELLIKAGQERIDAKKKNISDSLPIGNKLKKASDSASERLKSFTAAMTDVTAEVARERDLNSELNAFNSLVKDKQAKREKLSDMIKIFKSNEAATNPHTATIRSHEKKVIGTKAGIEDCRDEMAKKDEEVQLHEDAVEVFGQTGVRAHILDTVTPYLNERTSKYLSTLSDGNIIAEWNTLTTTAKGELREKFNIAVTNDEGAESYQGLSGGEKRKARLAAAMALQDMVASRASKPIELFIADEVDHALDESGLERLMSILNDKATGKGTVLVISHNELSDWIREQATVTKEAGYSTVTGVLS